MSGHTEIRVRELTDMGDWPWRYIVEGLTEPYMRKRWLWSREATIPVPPRWEQLRHGLRDYQPMQASDAGSLAHHYRAAILRASAAEGAGHE